MPDGTNSCGDLQGISTSDECRAAARALQVRFVGSEERDGLRQDCFVLGESGWKNFGLYFAPPPAWDLSLYLNPSEGDYDEDDDKRRLIDGSTTTTRRLERLLASASRNATVLGDYHRLVCTVPG